jgi:hypothetical protein
MHKNLQTNVWPESVPKIKSPLPINETSLGTSETTYSCVAMKAGWV